MTQLSKKTCQACEGGSPLLTDQEKKTLLLQLDAWSIKDRQLEKTFSFSDFKEALAFTNRVGEIAESEGHHPDLHLSWGEVKVVIWTHSVNGLTEADFILAAKIDLL